MVSGVDEIRLRYERVARCQSIEKSFEEVRDLAEQLVVEDKISSLHSLISEVCDGSGHKTIHFAVSRNQLETTQWILEIDPTCVSHRNWEQRRVFSFIGRSTIWMKTAIPLFVTQS